MARPSKEINKEQFESLCNLQCTLDEIAGFFKCSRVQEEEKQRVDLYGGM